MKIIGSINQLKSQMSLIHIVCFIQPTVQTLQVFIYQQISLISTHRFRKQEVTVLSSASLYNLTNTACSTQVALWSQTSSSGDHPSVGMNEEPNVGRFTVLTG